STARGAPTARRRTPPPTTTIPPDFAAARTPAACGGRASRPRVRRAPRPAPLSGRPVSAAALRAGRVASALPLPASRGVTLASTSGQPVGSQVQVNSLTDAHSLGLLAQAPPERSKHQPQA